MWLQVREGYGGRRPNGFGKARNDEGDLRSQVADIDSWAKAHRTLICALYKCTNVLRCTMRGSLDDADSKASRVRDVDWQDNDGALNTISMTHLLLAN
ncbi:hypothetical protein ACSQ67_024405 [Phaseolus vulgaris]